jgi:hypothetical protein
MRRIKNFTIADFFCTFNAIIQTYGLREIHMSGGMFTWSNNQKEPTLEKLDKVLMSREWESRFPMAHVYKNSRRVSDHNTLILTTTVGSCKKTIDFHFETSWLKDPEVIRSIQEIWEKPTRDECMLDMIHFKLKK